MKGSIGTPTNHYGHILPGTGRIARLKPLSSYAKQRLRWIDHYQKHRNVSLTCRHFGISRSLFYKWRGRHETLGLRGLEDRSKRPKQTRTRSTPVLVQLQIERLRRTNPAWSKYKIIEILRRDHAMTVSSSTCNRIFHDKNLFWPSPMKQSQAATRAWKIKRIRCPRGLKTSFPGAVVEIDHKVLNVFGRQFYQFTAIDTCTRIKFIRVYSNKSAHCGQKFVEALIVYYPFTVKHVQSDNGGEFLAECHAFLETQAITHYFSRARTPKDNPFVEATIKADEYEFWAWGNLATTVVDLNEKAVYWMTKFNTYRPHQALNYLTPQAFYEKHYLTL